MSKTTEPPEEDPFKDWSAEEKADWEATSKSRERLKAEISGSIVEKLQDLFFNDPEGGEMTDPDPDPDPDPGKVEGPKVPWFDKQLFGRKK